MTLDADIPKFMEGKIERYVPEQTDSGRTKSRWLNLTAYGLCGVALLYGMLFNRNGNQGAIENLQPKNAIIETGTLESIAETPETSFADNIESKAGYQATQPESKPKPQTKAKKQESKLKPQPKQKAHEVAHQVKNKPEPSKPSYEGPRDSYYGLFCNALEYRGTLKKAAETFDIPLELFVAQGIKESSLAHFYNGRVKVGGARDTGMYQITPIAYREVRNFYGMKINKHDGWHPWHEEIQKKLRQAFPDGLPSWQDIENDPRANIMIGAACDYISGEWVIKKRIGSWKNYSAGRPRADEWARNTPTEFWKRAMSIYNAGPKSGIRSVYVNPIEKHARTIKERWHGFF